MNFIRQLTLTLLLAVTVLLPSTVQAAWDESAGVYYMRTSDGLD